MSLRFSRFLVLFKVSIYFLVCIFFLPIIENGLLKSLAVTDALSIFPLNLSVFVL